MIHLMLMKDESLHGYLLEEHIGMVSHGSLMGRQGSAIPSQFEVRPEFI